MGKSRQSADLVSDNNIFVDISNDRVGIGTTNPQYDLDVVGSLGVSGIVTATSFYGDGRYLQNILSGVGVATAGGTVGTGATVLDFRGPGISTVTVSAGIATINITGGGGGGAVSIGTIAPLSPSNGDLWYSPDYGRTFVWYDEVTLGIGSTAVWVDAAPFNVNLSQLDDLQVNNLVVVDHTDLNTLNVSGISTLGNVVIGSGSTDLIVEGDARVTGILTIGTSSITLDGIVNQINVGVGVTLHHINGVQVGGNTLHTTGATLNHINVSGISTMYQLDVINDINFTGSLYQNGVPFSSGISVGRVYFSTNS
jgi:hypothetical protein